MNQRLAAGVLAGLSIALCAAETFAALAGLDARTMLLFLSLYAGLVGLLFALRTLMEGRREEIESVSDRRVRAKQDSVMGKRLEAYGIDDEFLGRGHRSGKLVASRPSATPAERTPGDEELKSAVIAYAGMVGGVVKLRETIESMDDSAFASMARKAGMSGVTRSRALAVVVEMVSAQSVASRDEAPALSVSIDKESFDDYIKRCMTEADVCADEDEAGNFAVDLDADGLSAMPSTPPTDFVHDPKAVMHRFNRTAGGR
ncbi:MAG: hypothetical protein HGB15_09810 [Chlorobaculum sp.]|nr:hypothetical protein [Chlorobaculum sp.]